MARFYHPENQQEHQRVFQQNDDDPVYDDVQAYDEFAPEGYPPEEYPPEEDFYIDAEDNLYDEDLLTDEDRAILRRERWRTFAHLGDFAGVIAGTAVILVLIALIISLLNWLQADITQSFTLWQTTL